MTPGSAACQTFLFFTTSQNLLTFMAMDLVMLCTELQASPQRPASEAGVSRSPKYLSPRSRNKINVFKVRVCRQDGQRALQERAEDRARSEWSLGRWGIGMEWVC